MKTTDKLVKARIQEHVLEGFGTDGGYDTDDKIANLRDQIQHMTYPGHNNVQAARDLVEGGKYYAYFVDAKKFLNNLGINPENKEYTDKESWDLYVHLLSREILELVEAE